MFYVFQTWMHDQPQRNAQICLRFPIASPGSQQI